MQITINRPILQHYKSILMLFSTRHDSNQDNYMIELFESEEEPHVYTPIKYIYKLQSSSPLATGKTGHDFSMNLS